MSRPRHYSQAAQAKRMTPDMLAEPEQDDDEQFEWYDEEPEPDAEQEAK